MTLNKESVQPPKEDSKTTSNNGDEASEVAIILRGLQGTGKSFVGRVLAEVLDGEWVNQDQLRNAKKGFSARKAFLHFITHSKKNILIIDKIHTQMIHFDSTLNALKNRENKNRVNVLVEFAHKEDRSEDPEKPVVTIAGDSTKDICMARVFLRGNHHCCLPAENGDKFIEMTSEAAENFGGEEDVVKSEFQHRFFVDIDSRMQSSVTTLLNDIATIPCLAHVNVSQADIEKAINSSLEFEKNLVFKGSTAAKAEGS